MGKDSVLFKWNTLYSIMLLMFFFACSESPKMQGKWVSTSITRESTSETINTAGDANVNLEMEDHGLGFLYIDGQRVDKQAITWTNEQIFVKEGPFESVMLVKSLEKEKLLVKVEGRDMLISFKRYK